MVMHDWSPDTGIYTFIGGELVRETNSFCPKYGYKNYRSIYYDLWYKNHIKLQFPWAPIVSYIDEDGTNEIFPLEMLYVIMPKYL